MCMIKLKEISPELYQVAEELGYRIVFSVHDECDIDYDTKEYTVFERNLVIEAQREFDGLFESEIYEPSDSQPIIVRWMCDRLIERMRSRKTG